MNLKNLLNLHKDLNMAIENNELEYQALKDILSNYVDIDLFSKTRVE